MRERWYVLGREDFLQVVYATDLTHRQNYGCHSRRSTYLCKMLLKRSLISVLKELTHSFATATKICNGGRSTHSLCITLGMASFSTWPIFTVNKATTIDFRLSSKATELVLRRSGVDAHLVIRQKSPRERWISRRQFDTTLTIRPDVSYNSNPRVLLSFTSPIVTRCRDGI
jgi:hypothetical protein